MVQNTMRFLAAALIFAISAGPPVIGATGFPDIERCVKLLGVCGSVAVNGLSKHFQRYLRKNAERVRVGKEE